MDRLVREPGTKGPKRPDDQALCGYPGKDNQDELSKAEYMTIRGDFRRAAIQKLKDAWRYEVPKTALPSYKLWGMALRFKWLYHEYQPIEFTQIENAEKGKLIQPQSGERAQLRQDTRGSGWHLPPINVPTPGNLGALEEALQVMHNTLFLCGWIWETQIVITWHHKVWARIK